MNTKLSIVIPVWNNWSYTSSCLQDLSHIQGDIEIVVVDNASSDETKNYSGGDRVRVVRNEENLGFARGCNIGYEKSSGQSVMFLNNDIRVVGNKGKWVDPIIEAAEDGSSIVGPTVGILRSDFSFVKEAAKIPKGGLCYMSGWNITAKRDVWDKLTLEGDLGPFSTEFGLAYFEDTDLGLRAKELGIAFKIVSVPVKHYGKMTSKKLDTSKLYLSAREKFLKKWRGR